MTVQEDNEGWPSVPFSNGSLLHLPSSREAQGEPIEWRPNEPFRARIRLGHFVRGRSAAYVIWADDKDSGVTYPMFLTDLEHLLREFGVSRRGRVNGTWRVVKRGHNYGLRHIDPPVASPEPPV